MKALAFAVTILALTADLVAQPPAVADEGLVSKLAADPSDGDKQPEPIKDVFPRFSVVGEWRVTHPWWIDTVTLRADGTILAQRQGSTGHWILTGDGGTPVIVIRWDSYGTESVAMVTPNHFRGQVKNGRFMDMYRGDEGAAEK